MESQYLRPGKIQLQSAALYSYVRVYLAKTYLNASAQRIIAYVAACFRTSPVKKLILSSNCLYHSNFGINVR